MEESSQDGAGSILPAVEVIDSRSGFHAAIRNALGDIAARGAREVWLVDPTFADWPISERSVVDTLTRWAYAHRRLTVMAQTFDGFERAHARWVQWRVRWSHVVACRQVHEEDASQMPTLLLAPGVVAVRLHDPLNYRGRVYRSAADWVRERELVDALEQRSTDSFPATTLGL